MINHLRKIITGTLVLLLLAGVFPSLANAQADVQYDVVIRNGRVLDGAGNPWIRADVAIRGGKFVRIGKITGKGKREIDATGKYVSPGWIDMQDQSGDVLAKNGLAESKLIQGITTGIAGEVGTPVPAEKLTGYFKDLKKNGISINFGTHYSEAQARVAVLGNESRAPTPQELARMRTLMEAAMKSGALGMSTALIYPPASYATTEELIAMAEVAGRHGGIYVSHIRGEGKELVQALEEAIKIGEKGNLPVEIYHLKAAYEPGWGRLMREAGETIEAARGRGLDVAANMYLYTAGGTGLSAVVPAWASEGGPSKLRERLEDPEIRKRLRKEIKTGSPGWWNIVEAAGGWKNIVLVYSGNDENDRFLGKNLEDIAKELKKDPADAAFDLILQGKKGRVSALYFLMSEEDVVTALKYPWTSLGSDAAASPELVDAKTVGQGHPRGYGNFPRLIARYVREKKVISLSEAIRKITSWPATRMRLASRGLIKEGLWADVVIFDYDKIQDCATFEYPYARPKGIDYVLVNGRVVMEDGRHTGARPGHVIYGPGRESK